MDPTLPDPETRNATALVDSDHPAVQAFARGHAQGDTDRERAVALYYAVRDGFRYDPYRLDLSPLGMTASTVLATGYGWCVNKASLLVACCRAIGIPARLGFADVRNHLATERLRQAMKTDVFAWHGYADLWLDGAWRKATPAFNIELCDRFGLLPLEFDGVHDSIYHPFDRAGNQHMEYVRQRGTFNDLPLAEMVATFREIYASPMPGNNLASELQSADFLADVDSETSKT